MEKTRQLEEGVFAAVISVAVSIFVSAFAYTLQCSSQYACIEDGTCKPLNEFSCSFANVVSPIGFTILNMTESPEALKAFSRGVCSPGERQTVDSYGRLRCVRAMSFPNAFISEIADPFATTDHEKACGKWIRAAKSDNVEYFSFFDEVNVQEEVTEAIKDDLDIQAGNSDVSRFIQTCKSMIVNSAVAPSVSLAYNYLKREVGSPTTQTDVLKKLGKLAAHYCDLPMTVGLTFHQTEDLFAVKMASGILLTADQASETLYSVGEYSHTREKVREFVSEMDTAPASMLSVPTNEQLGEILSGAVEDTWVFDSLTISSPVRVSASENSLLMLSKFLYAVEETSPEHATAYLLAAASQCALSVRSVVTGEFGTNTGAQEAAASVRRERASAASLGRLALNKDDFSDRFFQVGADAVFDASTITWSRLTHSSSVLYETSPQKASETCWQSAMVAFADALDRRVYKKLVSERVVSNVLPPLIETLKQTVASELQNGRMSQILASVEIRNTLAAQARSTQFRIAGAARTSPFGRRDEFERPIFSSDDGALLIMLKQAKAVFLDRIRLALDGSDLCQHPPLYASSSRNAYMLTSAPCAMLLPGILLPPFVSDRFDEKSLYGRIGFVISHEIAHVASKQNLWNMETAAVILANYSSSTWLEAAADLTAADAVVATGMLSSQQTCEHVSQLWCARPSGYLETAGRTHPPANLRGDEICRFLMSVR